MVKPGDERSARGRLGEFFFVAFCGACIILIEVMGGIPAFGSAETPDVGTILLVVVLILQSWRLYKAGR